jgi:uncharacterized CHY-type Zn-finger protein
VAWVILILVGINANANDLATTLYHPSKLDIVQIKFINCVVVKFKSCHDSYNELDTNEIEVCAFEMLDLCKKKNMLSNKDKVVKVATKCMISWIKKRYTKLFSFGMLFFKLL